MKVVTVPTEVLRYLINSNHTRNIAHTFMGGCDCPECEILRCWPQDDYDEFVWLVSKLNEIRNYKIVTMSKAEHKKSKKYAPNFKIKV